MSVSSVLSFSSVGKVYRSVFFGKAKTGLVDVSFNVNKGDSVGLIGHNGAGKSTSITIALGLRRPTSGQVLLQGVSPQNPLSRRGVAYVPERPLLYEQLSPIELLHLAVTSQRISVPDSRSYCMSWLDRFGIANVAKRKMHTFSKGMLQRSMLAYAMCGKPEILILDEPLSGLDSQGRHDVLMILQEYRSSGGTLIFSSHVMSDTIRLADHFVFFENGRANGVRDVDSILRSDALTHEILFRSDCGVPAATMIAPRTWMIKTTPNELHDTLALIERAHGGILQVSPVLLADAQCK